MDTSQSMLETTQEPLTSATETVAVTSQAMPETTPGPSVDTTGTISLTNATAAATTATTTPEPLPVPVLVNTTVFIFSLKLLQQQPSKPSVTNSSAESGNSTKFTVVYGSTSFIFRSIAFYSRVNASSSSPTPKNESNQTNTSLPSPIPTPEPTPTVPVAIKTSTLLPETVQKGLTFVDGSAVSIDFAHEAVGVIFPVAFSIVLMSAAPGSQSSGSRRLLVYRRLLLSSYAGAQVNADVWQHGWFYCTSKPSVPSMRTRTLILACCGCAQVYWFNNRTLQWVEIDGSAVDEVSGTADVEVTESMASTEGFSWLFAVMVKQLTVQVTTTATSPVVTTPVPSPPPSPSAAGPLDVKVVILIALACVLLVLVMCLAFQSWLPRRSPPATTTGSSSSSGSHPGRKKAEGTPIVSASMKSMFLDAGQALQLSANFQKQQQRRQHQRGGLPASSLVKLHRS